MSAERLRPEAEGALRRASARRVQGHKWVHQEWHVVAANIQIAPVNVGYVRQGVQILDGRPVGIMHHVPILTIGNAENVFDGLALGVFDDGVVELLAAGYVNYLCLHQRFFRLHADVGSDKSDFDVRIAVFDGLGYADVAVEPRSARKQHEQFVIFAGADRLFRRDVVRRGVEQARALDHPGRISEPDRIPVRFDFTRRGPARASAPVEILKRRRIQEQCF